MIASGFMLSARLMWRDLRSAELKLLMTSLILAVAMVMAIAGFTERLQAAITDKSSEFIAADRVLKSTYKVPTSWLEKADHLGIKRSNTLSFSSMLYVNDELKLASVKAVGGGYPLKGSVSVKESTGQPEKQLSRGPKPGDIWLDERLHQSLGLELGDKVELGDNALRFTAILVNDPDSGSDFSAFNPKAMMHLQDVEATGVVQPGSRVTYRYQLMGDAETLQSYHKWLKPKLSEHHQWQDAKSSATSVGLAIERAEAFLLLGGSVGVLLAGIAVALTAFQYTERHQHYVALLKTMGAGRRQINRLYLQQMSMVYALSLSLGLLLGFMLQSIFSYTTQYYFAIELPPLGFKPIALSVITGLVCVVAYALPPILALHRVLPMAILSGQGQSTVSGRRQVYILGVIAFVVLMYLYSGHLALSLGVLSGIVAVSLVLMVLATGLLKITRPIGVQAQGPLKLALSHLHRNGLSSAVMILIFAFSLMLLLVLLTTRLHLISDWQQQMPKNSPNHFLLNITKEDRTNVVDFFMQRDSQLSDLYPMVRGRLTQVNDVDITEIASVQERTRAGVNRELNLSYATDIPQGNSLVAGQWWLDNKADTQLPRVSVEQKMAKRLGIVIGDELLFSIGGLELRAKVSSVRKLRWDSLQPNFYFVFEPESLSNFSATYIASVYIPPEQLKSLNVFSQQFSNTNILDIRAITKQVQGIVNQVSMAVEFVSALIISAAILVMIATVMASVPTRLKEYSLLRALGANRGLILGSVWWEFGFIGLTAGVLAAFGAELVVFCLQRFVLSMEPSLHLTIWLIGPVLGVVIVSLAGYLSCRKVVNVSPNQVIRTN